MSIEKALILAAGRGSRLMPYTKNLPKCLVTIGFYPLLHYQLQALESNGIKNVAIATGYLGKMIEQYVKKNFPKIKTKFIHNKNFATTNDIYSFMLAKDFCAGKNFLQLDADVLFHPKILHNLLSCAEQNISVTCIRKARCGKEEMKVVTDKNDFIKEISKKIRPDRATGEFMSISVFTKNFSSRLFSVMGNTIKNGGAREYSGDAMGTVIKKFKLPFLAMNVSKYPIIEIDYPKDLKTARKIFS